MKNASIAKFTALSLQTVGLVLIVYSLIDCFAVAFPLQLLDAQWQINFTGQIMDLGIVPMVGIGFLNVGYWIESVASKTISLRGFSLRLPVFIFSLLLGLMFLALVPLHLKNLSLVNADDLAQIEESASVAEAEISERYEQLQRIAQDPERLKLLENRIKVWDDVIESGQLEGQSLSPQQIQTLKANKIELENFRDLAKNPETLKASLDKLQTQLEEQKQQRESRARARAIGQGISIGLKSLFLAIGYLVMGWFGLQVSRASQSTSPVP